MNRGTSSADRIRERFLSKIGIEAPVPLAAPGRLPTRVQIPMSTGNEPPQPQAVVLPPAAPHQLPPPPRQLRQPPQLITSCLGNVEPTYESLKVCLDDDSSIEDGDQDDSGFDDDDSYFIGDCGSADDAMAVEYFRSPESKRQRLVGHLDAVVGMKSRPPSPPPGVVSSDEGSSAASRSSSSSDLSLPAPAMASSSAPLRSRPSGILSRSPLSHGSLDSTASRSSYAGSKRPHPPTRRRRRVVLKSDVAVIPIPSRSEYSARMRERLWSSASELYRNAARNAVEFASEGWDWRTVTEDEAMLVHAVSGELVHPVHLRNAMEAAARGGGAGVPLPLPLLPNRQGRASPPAVAGADASEAAGRLPIGTASP